VFNVGLASRFLVFGLHQRAHMGFNFLGKSQRFLEILRTQDLACGQFFQPQHNELQGAVQQQDQDATKKERIDQIFSGMCGRRAPRDKK
jgi:hypothetical protein